MAYVTKERTAEVKKQLKKEFPNFKFSVTTEHHSTLKVCILQAPIKFVDKDNAVLNTYYPEKYEHPEILKKIFNIVNQGNYNHSDSQRDYFDVGFYVNIQQGRWDIPFKLTEK
jgi:hypothetical protein